jgi:hypothetical protein
MALIDYPLNHPGSYIRVQTGYHKRCQQPTLPENSYLQGIQDVITHLHGIG